MSHENVFPFSRHGSSVGLSMSCAGVSWLEQLGLIEQMHLANQTLEPYGMVIEPTLDSQRARLTQNLSRGGRSTMQIGNLRQVLAVAEELISYLGEK